MVLVLHANLNTWKTCRLTLFICKILISNTVKDKMISVLHVDVNFTTWKCHLKEIPHVALLLCLTDWANMLRAQHFFDFCLQWLIFPSLLWHPSFLDAMGPRKYIQAWKCCVFVFVCQHQPLNVSQFFNILAAANAQNVQNCRH